MSTSPDDDRGPLPRRRGSARPKKASGIWKWAGGGCAGLFLLGCVVIVGAIVAGVIWIDRKIEEGKKNPYWDGHPALAKHPRGETVSSVAYSPDGGRIYTMGSTGAIRIWDAETGASLLTIDPEKADNSYTTRLAFNPDWTRLAISRSLGSGAKKGEIVGTVIVWDVSTGKKLFSLEKEGHISSMRDLTYSPDGTRLATASGDKTAMVWDAKTGKELLVLNGHSDGVFGVQFSHDGTRLATASGDKTAMVWDAKTGKELLVLNGHSDGVFGVQFSRDGSRLVTRSLDKTDRLWDAATGKEQRKLEIGPSMKRMSSDGKQFWSGDKSGFSSWDAATGDKIKSTSIEQVKDSGHNVPICFAIHADAKRFARGYDNWITVWDMTTGEVTHRLRTAPSASLGPAPAGVSCVGFSPDGTRVVGGGRDGAIRVWKLDE